jgi:hypothetical protein
MPRPATKDELLTLSDKNYHKLTELVESIPKEKQEMAFPFEDRDKNIRDVLAHLHEWHLMMIKWYTAGMSGEKPVIPAEGYTWKTIPDLNAVIWKKYQDVSLETIIKKLDESHKEVEALIKKHSNDELFTKGLYPWTKTTSLGSYFISSTSSHYDWAIKKIRKFTKSY